MKNYIGILILIIFSACESSKQMPEDYTLRHLPLEHGVGEVSLYLPNELSVYKKWEHFSDVGCGHSINQAYFHPDYPQLIDSSYIIVLKDSALYSFSVVQPSDHQCLSDLIEYNESSVNR